MSGAPGHSGRGHHAALMAEARNLAESGGFNAPEIHRLFERRGVDPLPALVTIHRWVNEEYRRRNDQVAVARRAERRAEEAGGRLRLPQRALTPEFKLARMRLLRDIGLTDSQIARLMRLDVGDELTRSHVRHALELERYPSYF